MPGLLARLRAWREARTLERRPIPEETWQLTVARYAFIRALPAPELQRLRELSTLFLAEKEFSGAHGLEVTDEMAVAVAAQACLPVLQLGLHLYDGFVGIVMHPAEVRVRRETMDDDGIVHVEDKVMSGEAIDGGPMMLAWQDVAGEHEAAESAYNVVIHEFAHVLDMRNGAVDGIPPLPTREALDEWVRVMDAEYEAFCDRLDDEHPTTVDPYGEESIEEFFAVATEAFFVEPAGFQQEHPALYALFKRFFQQDPARRHSVAQNG